MKRWFFVAQALLFLAVAMAGFATSIAKIRAAQTPIPALAWLHGAVMMGWLLLYLQQARRIALGNVQAHRRLGAWAAGAAAFAVIAMAAAIVSSFRLPHFEDRTSFIYMVTLFEVEAIVLFTLFLAWGLRAVHRPDWHRRLMTLGTLVLLQPAVDRMDWFLPQLLVLRIFLLLLPLVIYDIATSRRVHPATMTGAALILLGHASVILFTVLGGEAWRLWLGEATRGLRI